MVSAATIYLIALKMARRVGHDTHEDRALRICQILSGYTGAGGVGGEDRECGAPIIETDTLALERKQDWRAIERNADGTCIEMSR